MDKIQSEFLTECVQRCKSNPSVLATPELKILRDWLAELGCSKLPTAGDNQPIDNVDAAEEIPIPIPQHAKSLPSFTTQETVEEESDFGYVENTIDELTEAIDSNLASIAELYTKRAQCFIQVQKLQRAVRDCDESLVINPNSAITYKLRGNAHMMLGDWEAAHRDLRRSCQMDYSDDAYNMLKEVESKIATRTTNTTIGTPFHVPHAHDIPDEIWHQIFALLPLREMLVCVPAVCKRWYALAYDTRLWHRLAFVRNTATPLPEMRRLLSGAPLLQQLQLIGYPHINDVMSMLCSAFHRLVAVDITKSQLSSASWQLIARHAQWPLRRLSLRDCNVTDDVVADLVSRYPNLEVLVVDKCYNLTDASLVTIANNLHRLRVLSLYHIVEMGDSGLVTLIDYLDGVLEFLTLGIYKLTDASLQLLRQCRRLHTLVVACSTGLTDATLLGGLRPLGRHLTRLCLLKGALFTEAGLCALFDVDYGGGGHLAGLTHLVLGGCTGVTDAVLAAVTRCCGARLVSLSIGCVWCECVTDAGLAQILVASAAGGGALEFLNISGLRHVTDAGLRDVATQLPRLRYLDVEGCKQVSDDLLTRLHTALPAAVTIDSSGNFVRSPDETDICSPVIDDGFSIDIVFDE